MRKCQIAIKLDMFGDQAWDGYHETIGLYADANTPYEAMSAALCELLDALRQQGHQVPEFGVRQHMSTPLAAGLAEEQKNESRKQSKAEQEQYEREIWETFDRHRAAETEQEE